MLFCKLFAPYSSRILFPKVALIYLLLLDKAPVLMYVTLTYCADNKEKNCHSKRRLLF